MNTLAKTSIASLFAGALVLAASPARADSNRDGGFVQGNILGVSVLTSGLGVGAGGTAGFPLELSAGYHVSGKQEGFHIGFAQRFTFSSAFFAASTLKMGWTIPISIKDMELGISPYFWGGPAYGDTDLRAYFGPGLEARFFPIAHGAGKGFFGTARPFDLGFMPIGSGAGTAIVYTFSVGLGYAF